SAQTLDELHEALPLLDWVRERALPSGVLAEQVDPYTNAPLSVSPLTWSHAEYVSTIRWYIGKYRRLMSERAAASHP
ncbi:MAG: glycoside hydrolase family 15 protein, partial [Ktedonobacterales bacterium]